MPEPTAESVLRVSLEPRAGGPGIRRLRTLVNAIGAIVGDDAVTRDTDLVVRRLASGDEVLRTTLEHAARDYVLAEAKADLARLGEDEFLREWSAR